MFWFAKKVSNVKSAEDILKDLNACIDYTFVMPTVTNKQLEDACNTAYKQKYRAISVNALHVAYVRSYLQEKFGESPIKIIANIAFPLGEAAAEVKAYEAKRAMLDGADEIQMVLSISQAKSGAYDAIKNEIHRVVRMVKKCKVGKKTAAPGTNSSARSPPPSVRKCTPGRSTPATPSAGEISG